MPCFTIETAALLSLSPLLSCGQSNHLQERREQLQQLQLWVMGMPKVREILKLEVLQNFLNSIVLSLFIFVILFCFFVFFKFFLGVCEISDPLPEYCPKCRVMRVAATIHRRSKPNVHHIF